MGYYFEIILTWLVIVTGVVAIVDLLFFARGRIQKFHQLVEGNLYVNPPKMNAKLFIIAIGQFLASLFFWKKEWYWKRYGKKHASVDKAKLEQCSEKLNPPKLVEYCKSFFPVLFLVLIIRSFLFSPYIIPSGSLEPTLLPGDLIFANKYSYGLRLPVRHTKITSGEPQLGDIFLFHFPPNPKIDYIKRVVGVPGDTISYINKVLYINGKKQPQKTIGKTTDDYIGKTVPVIIKEEDLNGIKHRIYINPVVPAVDFKNIKIPPGYFFAMGDNRDNSIDSRYWGFVPEKNIIGKASIIWLSKTPGKFQFRWNRLGWVH